MAPRTDTNAAITHNMRIFPSSPAPVPVAAAAKARHTVSHVVLTPNTPLLAFHVAGWQCAADCHRRARATACADDQQHDRPSRQRSSSVMTRSAGQPVLSAAI
jgi:hypothetical protein